MPQQDCKRNWIQVASELKLGKWGLREMAMKSLHYVHFRQKEASSSFPSLMGAQRPGGKKYNSIR